MDNDSKNREKDNYAELCNIRCESRGQLRKLSGQYKAAGFRVLSDQGGNAHGWFLDITAAFAVIEKELIASMMRNMERHRAEEAGMEQEKVIVRAIQRERRFLHLPERIQQILEGLDGTGTAQKIPKLVQMLWAGKTEPLTGEFFQLDERKLEAMVKATIADMEKEETAVLRMADDQYRRVIFNAQVYANTGSGTYEKAVDMATKDMLASTIPDIKTVTPPILRKSAPRRMINTVKKS